MSCVEGVVPIIEPTKKTFFCFSYRNTYTREHGIVNAVLFLFYCVYALTSTQECAEMCVCVCVCV